MNKLPLRIELLSFISENLFFHNSTNIFYFWSTLLFDNFSSEQYQMFIKYKSQKLVLMTELHLKFLKNFTNNTIENKQISG